MRLLPLLLLGAVALAACRTTAVPTNPIAGVWAVQALVDHGDSLSTTDGLPADLVRFELDGGVRVRSCNLCSGFYVLSDLHVVVRNLACTRRACPAERLELDRYLAGRAEYHFTDDGLVLDVDDPLNGIDARLYFTPVSSDVWSEE